ncbi:MAG: hypothetical protein H6R12_266 [Proteobacteria bacterium]|jgi:hypothetical protein|nr:hypothetical protein [Pseudomonadota bacterium]
MLTRPKESSALGFRHISRRLEKGESLPRLPSLIEQVMACRFEPSQVEEEETLGEAEWDDEADEPESLSERIAQ